MKVIVATPEELESVMINVLRKIGMQPQKKKTKVYSKNQVAKKLGLAHATVTKHCLSGLLKTTKDGRITEESIEEFLNGDN